MTQLSYLANESSTRWGQEQSQLEYQNKRLVQAVEHLSNEFEGLNSMSAAQSSNVQELVAMMREVQVDGKEIRHNLERAHSNISSRSAPPGEPFSERNGIYRSLLRICNLAAARKSEIHSKEAQLVIQDLQQLIVLLSQHDFSRERHQGAPYNTQEWYESQHNDALRKIENILRASSRVYINEHGKAWK